MSRGDLSLIPFLMFLIAATVVCDPSAPCLPTWAVALPARCASSVWQEIENEKRMTGMTEYDPDGYDIIRL